jgi:hypothetical protein
LRLVRDLEHYGTTINVDFDREFIGYHVVLTTFDNLGTLAFYFPLFYSFIILLFVVASFLFDSHSLEIQIAAESLRYLLHPLLQEYEVDRIRELVRSDSQALCEIERLHEAAHVAGFRDQGMLRL